MKPAKRFQVLKNKNLCFQCLYPGAKKNHEGNCYDQYACKHSSHKKFSKSKHVLVCEEHKEDEQNKELFEKYKSRFISNSRVEYKDFTKNMTLSFYADAYSGKNNDEIEHISTQEEVEQNLIDKSIIVNLEKCETIAKLPFIKNPTHRLSSNEDIAMKVYKSQIKKLDNCQEDKNEVIKSELKLQTLGYVEFVDKLPEEEKLKIVNSPIKYFIPWRVAWNPNSVSTFCRLVFDASMKTTNRYSLNDLLAKGRNNMNKLVEIVIRWRIHKFAYH